VTLLLFLPVTSSATSTTPPDATVQALAAQILADYPVTTEQALQLARTLVDARYAHAVRERVRSTWPGVVW
jgi:hypothetical protein